MSDAIRQLFFSVKHLELVKIILTFVAASVHNVRLTVGI